MQQRQFFGASVDAPSPPPCGSMLSSLIDICSACDVGDLCSHRAGKAAFLDDGLLLQEAYHRIKNDLQIVASLLSVQARASRDEALRAALMEAAQRVHAVSRLHQRLQFAGGGSVEISQLLGDLCTDLMVSGGDRIALTTAFQPAIVTGDQAAALALIANELVLNAIKYAFDAAPGRLWVSFHVTGVTGELRVCDDGPGLPQDALFSPGLGLTLVRQLARKLEGSLRAETSPAGGAAMVVSFPLAVLELAVGA